jgi:hypothetical protein
MLAFKGEEEFRLEDGRRVIVVKNDKERRGHDDFEDMYPAVRIDGVWYRVRHIEMFRTMTGLYPEGMPLGLVVEREKRHLLGDNPDWDGVGTHPAYGNGECGDVGELTCCISSVACPECREICRERGDSNEYIEKMWCLDDDREGE